METRVSGGDQWRAQVDRQIAVDKLANGAEPAPADNGSIRLPFPIELEGGKSRQGASLPVTFASVESRASASDPDLPLEMWLELRDRAPAGRERPTMLMEALSKAVEAEPGLTYSAACKAIKRTPESTPAKRSTCSWPRDTSASRTGRVTRSCTTPCGPSTTVDR